jgi:cation diffusion facilitator CzcD-associated flavoprotein CzcO
VRDKFVVCANSTLAEQRIDGMERSQGDSFRTSHEDHGLTGRNLEQPADVRVGIIGTGEGTVQIIPTLGEHAKSFHDFYRTHLSIEVPDDRQIGDEWAAKLDNGWQSQHQAKIVSKIREQADRYGRRHHGLDREQEVRRQENNDLNQMMRIHKLIDNTANDQTTAEA